MQARRTFVQPPPWQQPLPGIPSTPRTSGRGWPPASSGPARNCRPFRTTDRDCRRSATVNVPEATCTNAIGAPAPETFWKDPSFDPAQREQIEHLQPGPPEVAVVSRGDRQPVPTGRRGDVAVLDGHALTGFLQQALLFCPHVSDRHVEPVDAAAILFRLEPGDHLHIALLLRRLADDIRIEQPAHSFRRFAGALRRAGTSSGLTGQSLSTANQFSPLARRRNTMASSSGSKRASK